MKMYKYKQRGASGVDILIYLVLLVAIISYVIAKVPEMRFSSNVSSFQSDTSTISNAAFKWKKRRPNYASISLDKLCTDNYLSESICGSSNDGKSTNPFGGDWTLTANSNPGLYDITATFPNDTDHINEIADTMASATRAQCSESEGCSTLTKTANSITMTF